MNAYYLNDDGSRWTYLERAPRRFLLVLPDGTSKVRLAHHFESFGQWVAYSFRYAGRIYSGLPDDFRDDATGLPVVALADCRSYPDPTPCGPLPVVEIFPETI